MMRRGLLLTMTEPPAAMEEEFNAWYDSEHLAERLAITGFRSARRWVANCAPGEGEYLARFAGATPWTRRCLEKTVLFRRWACEQTEPGDAKPHPGALQARRFIAHPGTPAHIALIELAWPQPAGLPSGPPGALLRLYRAYGA